MRLPPSLKHVPLAVTISAAAAFAGPAIPEEPVRHVILVPGIWDTFRTLQKMEQALRAAGLETTMVTLTPNNGRAGLDTLAAQMREQIDRQVPPGTKFSIVGFSMGGLVARSYLRQFVEAGRVAAFISISSPHRGTWTAWFAGGEGVRDMRPGSAFLTAVDADATRHRTTRWITIRTPFDLMILPSESSALPWAHNSSVPVLVHPLMACDGGVIRRVVQELTAPRAVTDDIPLPTREPAR